MNSLTGRSRTPALVCAIVFLLCEAISLSYAEMAVCDDWSYIRTAQLFAQTGHVHYNGWGAVMVGWQLFAGAALLKLFGFSFTVARLSSVFVAALTTFLMQRTFVRAGISERNATIGTLAIVLTPLYMELSATFMTDLPGLFAVVVCLYGCLRALQADSSAKATWWICFAALANMVFGTCRQISWLGLLVMVPCALWLLRRQRKTLVAGCVTTLVGWAFIAFCMHWFEQQPYAIPEHVFFKVKDTHQLVFMAKGLLGAIAETPFLILPIVAAYLVVMLNGGRRFWRTVAFCGLVYGAISIAFVVGSGRSAALEPILGDWVTPRGGYGVELIGTPMPLVLNTPVRALLTAVSVLSTLCAVAFLWTIRKRVVGTEAGEWHAAVPLIAKSSVSWKQLVVLTGPFAAAYFVLLIPRSSVYLMDRYLLTFTFLCGLFLVRAFQDFVRRSLPAVTKAFLVIIAIYSIGSTHDMFAFYRAHAVATGEIRAAGVQPNMFDGGFEYNRWTEILQGGHINDKKIISPANSYIEMGPYRGWSCDGLAETSPYYIEIPHFSPRYGLSFEPNRCAGESTFAPVHYFRWLGLHTTWLYIVKYQPSKLGGQLSTVQPNSPHL
jgi:hypothetical protein